MREYEASEGWRRPAMTITRSDTLQVTAKANEDCKVKSSSLWMDISRQHKAQESRESFAVGELLRKLWKHLPGNQIKGKLAWMQNNIPKFPAHQIPHQRQCTGHGPVSDVTLKSSLSSSDEKMATLFLPKDEKSVCLRKHSWSLTRRNAN